MRSALKLALAAGTTAALATTLVTPASADPPSGVTPAANAIVGVGSDTTQFLVDQFALNYNATSPARELYSWDATGTSPITTKTGATSIPRPDGSGAGITALVNNTTATVDFARSSRGRGTSDSFSVGFVAMTKDAVSVAVQTSTRAPKDLTTAQLQDIYTCTATTWDQVGGTTNKTIKPFLPQSGSGTRSFFLTSLGLTDANIGGCVTQGVQENEGTDSRLKNPDSIVPYSVAKWISQVYHSGAGQNDFGTDDHGSTKLDKINGTAPISGKGAAAKINPNFNTANQRVVYNVVRKDSSTADQIPAYLEPIFGAKGYICKNGADALRDYGFLPLPKGQCGVVS